MTLLTLLCRFGNRKVNFGLRWVWWKMVKIKTRKIICIRNEEARKIFLLERAWWIAEGGVTTPRETATLVRNQRPRLHPSRLGGTLFPPSAPVARSSWENP